MRCWVAGARGGSGKPGRRGRRPHARRKRSGLVERPGGLGVADVGVAVMIAPLAPRSVTAFEFVSGLGGILHCDRREEREAVRVRLDEGSRPRSDYLRARIGCGGCRCRPLAVDQAQHRLAFWSLTGRSPTSIQPPGSQRTRPECRPTRQEAARHGILGSDGRRASRHPLRPRCATRPG